MPSIRPMALSLRVSAAACALACACGLPALLPGADAPGGTRLLRFPATNGRQIVFSYGGQLFTVGMDGGTARRLTDGPGYAIFPRFSADGSRLAYTAQYDGNTEVYVMPAEGGTPKRLTYTATLGRDDLADRMGPNNVVMAWKNTRPEIVFRSRMRSFNDFVGQLYTVGLEAELPVQLPVPRGGFLSFSPDDAKMAYNRVFREFRTWKNYRGGMADDVWVFDFASGAAENITNSDAQDIFPMWAPNGRIYFASDRDGRLNLFSYDPARRRTAQHTQFRDFDVKFPSLGGGWIAFEQAGEIWLLNTRDNRSHAVRVVVQEDAAAARPALVNVSKAITEVHLAPDGRRVVAVARGDVFTVPAKNGPTRNLSRTSGVHERGAAWSPDGRWIACVSDATGENELVLYSQDGRGGMIRVTTGGDSYYFSPTWSPDSTKLAWGDRAQRLRYVDVNSKEVVEVESNPSREYTEYSWSPDSRWLAYTRPEDYGVNRVRLYSLAQRQSWEVTDEWYQSGSPVFSDDGRFLLLVSSRDFRPIYSDTEWNHAFLDMERIYLVALARSVPSPFAPKSDEVNLSPGDKAAEGGNAGDKEKKDAPKAVTVQVDPEGLRDRIIALPIAPSNYSGLRMVGEKVFYLRRPAGTAVDTPDERQARTTLACYDLKERKETELGNAGVFEISQDGRKMLVRQGRDHGIIDLPSAKIELKEKLDFSGLEASVDYRAEWSQIYHECWRQMRDYFYAPNMHGVDWPAQREKYAGLLPFVQTRNDLTYLIGELISELRVGHAYVGGGERVEAPRLRTGLLGAEFSRDPASRAYRIDRILPGENWRSSGRSPLTEMGVDVKPGEYILAINGTPVRELENIYAALVGTAGKQVVLRVNQAPREEGAREVTVIPIADESDLYYRGWVQRNIAHVAEKTGGQVGYIHIPDMGTEGLSEFVKHFYPQLGKKALIIDDRGNGGGNVSPQIIERLRREHVMINLDRGGQPVPNPGDVLVGPSVVLMNEYSASDGDIFPFRFRAYGLGKLIGRRSWGGVVGIRGTLPLIDGGSLNKPEFASYAKDGTNWVIEGRGVDPDIVVDNDPSREFRGEDQQLDKAIEVILEELRTGARSLPPPPPYPVK